MQALEIYAHRGFAAFWPENTLLSFQKSLEIGVDSLDIDVAITKDNIVVGSHDPFLNKDITLDSNNRWIDNEQIIVSDITYNELQKYSVGKVRPNSKYSKKFPLRKDVDNIKAPSLDEVIELIKAKGRQDHKIQIEVKTNPNIHSDQYIQNFITAVVHTLEEHSFVERAEIQSFDWRNLLFAKKLNPKIKVSFITEQTFTFNSFVDTWASWFSLRNWKIGKASWTAGYKLADYQSIIDMIATLGADVWCPHYKNVTKKLVKEAHSKNIRVVPWTADTKQDMLKLINDGVDGIITNRSDILREVMASQNMVLPV